MITKESNWHLYICTLTANLLYFSSGCLFTWNSPILPKLESNDTNINPFGKPITIYEKSIITSIFPFGALIGSSINGKICDLLGRKTTLIYTSMVLLILYIGTSFATHVYIYVILFTLLSVTGIMGTSVVGMYINEIAKDDNRGKLGCSFAIGLSFAQFSTYLIGPLTSMRVLCLVCCIPVIIFLLLSFKILPESPIDLLKIKKNEKGSIQETEMESLNTVDKNEKKIKKKNFFEIFETRSGTKSFALALGLRTVQQLSGVYIIFQFLGPLLNKIGGSISGHTLAAILALGKIVIAIIACSIIEKTGKKTLLLLGTGLCGFGIFLLGLYYCLKSNNIIIPQYLQYFPVFPVLLVIVAYSFGLSAVPNVVINEILPNEYRAVGNSFVGMIAGILNTIVLFSYPFIEKYYGAHYPLFGFSAICMTGFIFIYKLLPETKGKSFDEIQKLL